MSCMVAANIVTGFLGSGKTTLIRSALKNGLAGRKVALIVNDFGEIGIDGVVLKGVNVDKMIELPSGCICCTVGSRFALAVQEIVDTVKPHLIVIETSGVADPGPILSELALIGVKTDSVIALADAQNVIRFCEENGTAVRQLEAAHFIVLNKTDRVSSNDLERVEKYLRKINTRALMFPTTFGEVKEEILFATSTAAYWSGNAEVRKDTDHLEHDQLTSFSYRREGLINRDRFERFLLGLPDDVYRAKGIVQFSGESWSSVFNYTCGYSRIDWLSPEEGQGFNNRAVVIGKNLVLLRETILKDFEKCVEA